MNKNTLYSFWSIALIICLVLAVFAVVFASVLGNHSKTEPAAAATPAPAEPTAYVEPAAETPAVSAAALAETEDAGAEYVDGIFFLGDQALSALKDDGMLTGADAAKQVWVPAEGRLPLQGIDTTAYHSPVTGNNAPAADIALVNKPAVILIYPSADNGNMVTREELIDAYTKLVSSMQEQSPDTKIILCSLTPLAASYDLDCRCRRGRGREISRRLRRTSERAGLPLRGIPQRRRHAPEQRRHGGLAELRQNPRIPVTPQRTHNGRTPTGASVFLCLDISDAPCYIVSDKCRKRRRGAWHDRSGAAASAASRRARAWNPSASERQRRAR